MLLPIHTSEVCHDKERIDSHRTLLCEGSQSALQIINPQNKLGDFALAGVYLLHTIPSQTSIQQINAFKTNQH